MGIFIEATRDHEIHFDSSLALKHSMRIDDRSGTILNKTCNHEDLVPHLALSFEVKEQICETNRERIHSSQSQSSLCFE
jgi:hypothetical protein